VAGAAVGGRIGGWAEAARERAGRGYGGGEVGVMRQGFLRSGLWEWEVSGESENERTRERASERARETEAEEGDEREHSTET
jgi:hypothetical protein